MNFTDDDLKRLKEIADDVKHRHRFHGDEYIKKCSACKLANPLEALLARLEAAELLIDCILEIHNRKVGQERGDCKLCQLIKAWRKAAGKE